MCIEFQGFQKLYQAFKDFNLDKTASVPDLYFNASDCDKILTLLDDNGLSYSIEFDPTVEITVDSELGMVNFCTEHIQNHVYEKILSKFPNCNKVDKNAYIAECQLDEFLELFKELKLTAEIKYKKSKRSQFGDIPQ